MADRRQAVVAAWPPRALLALTTPRAGWLEVERALLPSARVLPPPLLHRALRQASSRSAIAAPASPSPSSRTTAKTRRPACLELRRVRLSVLHRLADPLELR